MSSCGPRWMGKPTSSPRRRTRRENGESTARPTASGKWRLAKPGVGNAAEVIEVKEDKAPPLNVTLKKGAAAPAADPMAEVNATAAEGRRARANREHSGRAEDLRGPAREVSADLPARRFHRANLCGREQRSAGARASQDQYRQGNEPDRTRPAQAVSGRPADAERRQGRRDSDS